MENINLMFTSWIILIGSISHVTTDEIALNGKVVAQSGTYGANSANLATDGNVGSCCIACTCDPKYTGDKTNAWWQVDLAATYTISSVVLTNSADATDAKYLQNFIIWIGPNNNTDGNNNQICYTFNNGSNIPPSQTVTITCNSPSSGRFITIKRQGGYRPDAISLCDFRVFGSLKTINEVYLSDKTVIQSGTYGSKSAGLAVDKSTGTCSVACTKCDSSYTGDQAYGWWQVDLAATYMVYSISLSNSGDATDAQYLQNFIIWIGPNNNTDGNNNQICYTFNNGSNIPPSQTVNITCNSPSSGRFITIKRQGGYRPDAISLCDFRVFVNTSVEFSTIRTTTTTTVPRSSSTSLSSSPSSKGFVILTSSTKVLNELPTLTPPTTPTTTNNSVVGIHVGSDDQLQNGKTGIIVGVVIGGALLICVGIIIAIVLFKRYKKTLSTMNSNLITKSKTKKKKVPTATLR